MLGGSVRAWTSRSWMASFKLRSLLYSFGTWPLVLNRSQLFPVICKAVKEVYSQPSASHLSLLPTGAFHDCHSPWDYKNSLKYYVRDFLLCPVLCFLKWILTYFTSLRVRFVIFQSLWLNYPLELSCNSPPQQWLQMINNSLTKGFLSSETNVILIFSFSYQFWTWVTIYCEEHGLVFHLNAKGAGWMWSKTMRELNPTGGNFDHLKTGDKSNWVDRLVFPNGIFQGRISPFTLFIDFYIDRHVHLIEFHELCAFTQHIVSFPYSLLCFLRIPPPDKLLVVNPCLRICFLGNQRGSRKKLLG